jgi:hypothetical protein
MAAASADGAVAIILDHFNARATCRVFAVF